MDATLHALGGILLKAVPTFVLVVLLHFYLKAVFFKPLQKVLEQRYEVTEGARKVAEKCFEHASAKAAQYDAAMRAARAEVYQAQEQSHKELEERHAGELADTRRRAEIVVKQAKAELAKDVEAAKAGLARDSELLADRIAESILRRGAA